MSDQGKTHYYGDDCVPPHVEPPPVEIEQALEELVTQAKENEFRDATGGLVMSQDHPDSLVSARDALNIAPCRDVLRVFYGDIRCRRERGHEGNHRGVSRYDSRYVYWTPTESEQ